MNTEELTNIINDDCITTPDKVKLIKNLFSVVEENENIKRFVLWYNLNYPASYIPRNRLSRYNITYLKHIESLTDKK